MTWKVALAGVGLVLFLACSHTTGRGTAPAQETNQVVRFLDQADRQSETDEQRREILRALVDLRTLDAVALKRRRYADYGNKPGQWTLVQLIQKYFVPPQPCSIDEEAFYRHAQTPQARKVVEQQIRALQAPAP